jgi:geranylgeranyl reductase family protein
MYDIIVVGGGPAGSRIAGLLAEKGHHVLVLERLEAPRAKCCTGIIGIECVETFNIPDSVILRRVNSASLFSPSGKRLHVYRDETQAVILDRAAFDASMRARAERAGAEYRGGARATDIKLETDGVAVIMSACEKESRLKCKCAVIACGFETALLQRLGLGAFKDFAYGAQAEVEIARDDEVKVSFGDMAPGFFAWLVPVTPSRARAGLLTRGKPGEYLQKWLESLKAAGEIVSADVQLSFGAIPLKPLARTYNERLLVVGDAAGQVKPTSGGGIYYGLLCADIAARTLLGALAENDFSALRLSAYEKAWRAKLGQELRNGYWARKMFERLSGINIDRLFKLAKAMGIEEAVSISKGISFDWHSRTIKQLLKYQLITRTLKIGGRSSGSRTR